MRRLAFWCLAMERSRLLLLLPLLQTAALRPRDGCSPGWERCPSLGLCVPSGCRGEDSLDRSVPCGDTMVFCPRAAACITHCNSGAWDHPSNAQQPGVCGPGQGFCPSSGQCVSAMECPEEGARKSPCPPGTHFCPAQGGCVLGQCDHEGYGQQPHNARARSANTGPNCPPGTAFCLSRGECTEPGKCEAPAAFTSGRDTQGDSCDMGQVFCLQVGRCVATGECDGTEGSGSGDMSSRSRPICMPGQAFCLQSGRCVATGECNGAEGSGSGDMSSPSRPACKPGQVFCADRGMCVAEGQCGGGTRGGVVCGAEQEFCLSSQQCEPQGRCPGRNQDGWDNQCPSGMVYCMATGSCVLAQVGCGDTKFPLNDPFGNGVFPGSPNFPGSDLGSDSSPPPGTEAVQNMCRPMLDHCPTEPKCANFCNKTLSACVGLNSSTCLQDDHCPDGQSCCTHPDTGYKRCSSPRLSSIRDDLQRTCSLLKEVMYSTGLSCSLPGDCPADSVCCNGSCRSSAGVVECPSSTLYCSVTNRCHRLGERCARACGPGKIYCITADECTAKNDCEFGAFSSGSPWMMPRLIYLDGEDASESPVATLGQLLGDGLTLEQLEASVYVTGTRGARGKWQVYQNDRWIDVQEDLVFMLSMKQNLRFLPTFKERAFAYALLSLIEQSGNTKQVVQLLAPAPSPLLTSITDPYLEVLEDEVTVVPINKFVGLQAPLEEYMAPWTTARRLRMMLQKPVQLLAFSHPAVEAFLQHLDNASFSLTDHPAAAQAPASALRLQLEDSAKPIVKLAFSAGSDGVWTTIPSSSVLQVPLGTSSDLTKVKLKLIPYPDTSGRTSLTVVSGQFEKPGTVAVLPAEQLRGPRSYYLYQRGRNITIEVQSSNDAPTAREVVQLSSVPTLTEKNKAKGFLVKTLSSLFYSDADGKDSLGLAVLYAQQSTLGQWQYSLDTGASWTTITGLNLPPISGAVLSGVYQGFVDLEKTLSGPECNLAEAVRNGQDLTSILQSEECINRIKEQAEMSARAAKSSNKEQALLQSLQQLALRQLQATFSGAPDGQLKLTQAIPSINALFLPPLALLRYMPNTTLTKPWGKIDAATKTRLMFTAWDRSDSENFAANAADLPVENRTVQLFNCPLCGGGSSGALVPAVVVAEWSGCGGVVVDSEALLLEDACGECGGDNSSCTDCHGDVAGGAVIVCAKCTGGKTGVDASALRDCAGRCLAPGLSGGDVVCTQNVQNAVMCDGQIGSSAAINECGYCVQGSTGRPQKEGLDKCGVCDGGDNCLGCDQVPNSGKVTDLCGACLKPSDSNFNACEAVGDLQPSLLDVAMASASSTGDTGDDSTVTLKAKVAGLSKASYGLRGCSLVKAGSDSDIIPATTSIFRDTTLVLRFSSLKEGTWQLLCEFTARSSRNRTGTTATAPGPTPSTRGPITPTPGSSLPVATPDNRDGPPAQQITKLRSNSSIVVVDSTSIKISLSSGSTIESGKPQEVVLKVDGKGLSGDTRCYLAYGKPDALPELVMSLEVSSVSTTTGQVTCSVKPNAPAGAARVGVVLVQAVLALFRKGSVSLPGAAISIKGGPPTATNATLSDDGRTLELLFDTNIQVTGDCLKVFSDGAALGTGSSCKVRGDRIIFKLGSSTKVMANMTLTLSTAGGSITRHSLGGVDLIPAVGSVVVLQPVVLEEESLDFELIGDAQACNGTSVHITAKPDRYVFFDRAEIFWNITFKENPFSSQNQKLTLDTWDSVRKLREDMKKEITNLGEQISLPGNKFLPGMEYLITAQAEMNDGSRVGQPKGLSVKQLSPSSTYHVTVRGATSIKANRDYHYQAIVSSCSEDGDQAPLPKLMYTWSIDGSTTVFGSAEGDSVTLPKNFLMGGQTHVLSVQVMETDDLTRMGKGMLLLQVQTQGLQAMVSTASLKAGTANVVRVSAAASKDLDNRPGKLSYMWSCKTSDGKRCYVSGTGGVMEQLEFRLKEKISSKLLIIPGALLSPGMYELTVTVAKDNRTADATMMLELQQGTMPEVQLAVSELLVDPTQKVVVKASFTSEAGAEVQWQPVVETGFSTVELIDVATGATPITFSQASKRRPFPLVIPPADTSKGWPGLQDDAVFKFRLLVTEGDKSGFSDLVIKTNSPPSGGKFVVSPSSGKALVTNFEFSATGWTDNTEDLPLSVTFGYSIPERSNGEVSWLSPINGDMFNRSFSLPGGASPTKVTPWVRACDTHHFCAVEAASAVTVTLPDSLPPEVFAALSGEITQAMDSHQSVEAGMQRAAGVLATLAAMGDTSSVAAMQMLVEDQAKAKIRSLETSLDSEAAQAAAFGVMDGALALAKDVDLSADLLLKVKALNSRLLSQLNGLPLQDSSSEQIMFDSMNTASMSSSPSNTPIYYPETDEDLNAARNGDPNIQFGVGTRGGRRKRAAENGTQPSYKPMTEKNVRGSILISELIITQGNMSDGVKASSTDELIRNMQTYAAGLCLSAESGETLTVAEQLVGLSVRKSQLLTETDQKLAMVFDTKNNKSFIKYPNYEVWGPVVEQFVEWQCGKKDPDTGEAIDCYGACLVSMHFNGSISAPRTLLWADIGRGLRLRGEMVRSAILNPETGAEVQVKPATTASEYSIMLNNTSINANREFKCLFWNTTEEKWQSNGCNTLSIVTDRGKNYEHCQCSVPGYLGVFSVPKLGSSNDTESESFTRSYKNVKFIINENYTGVVGKRKTEFEDYLTTQTAEKLGVMRDQIHNLTVSPGSILVEFQLMEEMGSVRSSSMKDIEDLRDRLQQLINSGDLKLVGFESEQLKIPPQCIDDSCSTPNRAETNMRPIIIGGVVAGIMVIGIVLLGIAIYRKNKKQRDKVSPMQATPIANLPPSYRSIHFEQALDGSAASLAKRNPHYADLDTSGAYTGDGLYIEHHSKSSASSMRSSGLGSSIGSGGLGAIEDDDAPVPAPFRYKSPTKSELDRSGPIPPHILERMRETEKDLPTPGSDVPHGPKSD